jgi:8-oxo-dGTP pyrophosphatase MutT (NUDIX family)
MRLLHPAAADFAGQAAKRLLPEPRRAGADAFGDYAINGLTFPADKAAILRPAAVLIGIGRESGGVLFTERARHLAKHPGQISFPGGRIDLQDGGPREAALREAEEEVGLPREAIEVLGFLDEYFTGTGFRVTPVVALIEPFTWRLNAAEVDGAFEAPIERLMQPSLHEEHFREIDGIRRRTYAFRQDHHYIWGVTAGIIRALYDRVYGD